jgi:hypothetical protein
MHTAQHSKAADDGSQGHNHGEHVPEVEADGIHPTLPDDASVTSAGLDQQATGYFDEQFEPNVRTRLLNSANWDIASGCGEDTCGHGAFSPRPERRRSYGSFMSEQSIPPGFGGRYPGVSDGAEETSSTMDAVESIVGENVTDRLLGGRNKTRRWNTTRYLAAKHGVKNRRAMCELPPYCQPSNITDHSSSLAGILHITFLSSIGYDSIDWHIFAATL